MSDRTLATVEAPAKLVSKPAASGVLQRQGIAEQDWQEGLQETNGESQQGAIGCEFSAASPPPPEVSKTNSARTTRSERDLLGAGVHSPNKTRPSKTIHDEDIGRALLTEWLLRELAPLLGVDPDKLEIRVNHDAESRATAKGASALQEGNTVYLHPERFDPGERDGRYLLAHEVTHAAQRRPFGAADREGAEREAAEIGKAFAIHGRVRKPQCVLPLQTVAADTDASGTADNEKAQPDLRSLVEGNYAEELREIKDALSYGVFDWAITDSDVETVLRILEPLPLPTRAALINALADPYPARLADNISKSHFQRFRSSVLAVYYALLQRQQVEKLQDDPFAGMSWTGFSKEEHFTLHAVIPAFQRTAKGKAWYERLSQQDRAHVEDLLKTDPQYNEEDERKKAAEAEQQRKAERAASKELVKDTAGDVYKFIQRARKMLSYSVLDWAITDGEARTLLDEFADFTGNQAKMRAIVETLEGEGYMDRWVDNIPVGDLYTDVGKTSTGKAVNRRKVFLHLLSFRPARKNAQKAEELLSYGLLDWAITDEDAFLALQLVKSLPKQVREGFYAAKGGKYATRLDEELSLSMKKGKTANYYSGGENGSDLRSIQTQLLEDTTWSLEQMSRLRILIQMAQAAGEGAWVFQQSKDRFANFQPMQELYQNAEFFLRVVEGFRLYVPAKFKRPDGLLDKGREEYEPEKVKGKPFGTDNFFWMYIVEGLGFVFHSNRIQIFKESIGGEGLDFGEFQDIMGGSFMGAEFRRASQAIGQEKEELLDNSVRWDLDHGVLELRAARLDVLNINYQMAQRKIQAGETKALGVHLHLEYPASESKRNQTIIRLRVDSLELNDLLLINPDSMSGIEQITVRDLYVDLYPDTPQLQLAAVDESYALGAIFLTPLYNLWKIGGSGKELRPGILEPPTALNLTVTAGQLLLKGLTTSGGQHVASIRVDDIALRGEAPKRSQKYLAWLKAEQARLGQRLAAVKQQAAAKSTSPKPRHYLEFETERSLTLQLNSVVKEIANISEAEAEKQRLTNLSTMQALSPADEQKLKRLTSYLSDIDTGGIAIDVGHAEVKGVVGRLTMGDVSLDELHSYGHSAGSTLGFLTNSSLVNRILRGPEYRGTIEGVEQEGDPMAFVKLGQLETGAIDVQGAIPTQEETEADVKQARAALEKHPLDHQLAVLRDRMETRFEAATAYWTVANKRPEEITAADRQKFNDARKLFLQDKAFHADKITLKNALVELAHSKESTSVGLEGEEFSVYGVQSHGLRIREGHGKNVRIGAGVASGTGAFLTLNAEELRLQQLSLEESGISLDEVAIQNLGAQLKTGQDASLGVRATTITATGVNRAVTERVLLTQRDKLLQKPEDQRTATEKRQLEDIQRLLEELAHSKQTLAEATQKLADPKLTPQRRHQFEMQKEDAEKELAFWQKKAELKKLTISDFDIDISGLGDVLADDYSPSSAYKRGITITGAGKDKQMLSGISATGAWTRLGVSAEKSLPGGGMKVAADPSASVGEIKTGPIRGSVELAEDHVSLSGFGIENIDITKFNYNGGESVIASPAKSSIQKLSVTARLKLQPVDENEPEGDRYVSGVHIDHFEIGTIAGNDIDYRNYKSKLHVHVQSGKLRDISVEGVDVDLLKPGAKDEFLKIHGGKARVGKAEDIRAAATTASGMAVRGALSANKLEAGFAEDGTVTADLLSLSLDAGSIKQRDLDVKFNAKAKGLHFTLIPGAKGYEDSTQKIRADELQAHAEVHKGTHKVAVDINRATFGDLIRRPDGTIIFPSLRMGTFTIRSLAFNNDQYKIDVPPGQPVTFSDTEIAVRMEPNRSPKSQDDFAFDQILVQKLKVARIDFHGLTFALKEKNLTLTLPNKDSGYLLGLELTPDEKHPEGFVIEPNQNWNMIGKLGFSSAQLKGLSADMPGLFVQTADVGAEGFSLGFMGSEGTTLDLKTLTAENVEGNIAGSKFTVMKGSTRHKVDPKLRLHDLKQDKDGKATFGDLDLQGFRYEDTTRGTVVDLMKATLPKRELGQPAFEMRDDGSIRIPVLKISEAYFRIEDVLHMGGGTAAKTGESLDYGPDWGFLDRLNGHVNFDVHLEGTHKLDLLVRIPVTNGQFNFATVRDKAFEKETLANWGVSMFYTPPQYNGALPARLTIDLAGDQTWWNLSQEEAELAANHQVRISSFFKREALQPMAMPWHEPKTASVTSAQYRNVDVDLQLPGGTKIVLGNAGYILLGSGNGLPFRLEARSSTAGAFVKSLSLNLSANVKEVNLKTDEAGSKLTTGDINISSVNRTTLTFVPGRVGLNTVDVPRTLEGTLEEATAHNIVWTPVAKREKK